MSAFRFISVVFVTMSVGLSCSCVCAESSGKGDRVEHQLGRGIVHISDLQDSGPTNFSVLKVPLADPNVTVEVEPAKDRMFAGERVPETAERESRPGHAVIGAVNADFWSSPNRLYIPVGMLVANSMIGNFPHPERSVFAVTEDERISFEPLSLKIIISADGKKLEVEKLNRDPAADAVTLFTPLFGPEVPRSSVPRLVLELERPEFLPNKPVSAKVVRRTNSGEAVSLSERTVILSAPEPALRKLGAKVGDTVHLEARVPEIDGVVAFACGGAPRIVRDGKVSVEWKEEKVGKSFATARHPRTAVGVSSDGRTLYLVTVDGRQPTISVGAGLEELAKYMVSLGCADAVNLDGGGSTTMVVRGDVVNRPSDATGPRPVANSILVVGTAPTGPLARLEIEPEAEPLTVPVASRTKFSVRGYDADFSPVKLEGTPVRWSAEKVGKLSQTADGAVLLQSVSSPAAGTLTASSGSASDTVPVHVVGVDTLSVQPEVLLLSSGETGQLKVEAFGSGRRIPLQPEMIETSASDAALSASATAVAGLREGQGILTVTVGGVSRNVPFFVDRFESKPIEPFDELPEDVQLSGSNYDAEKTRLTQVDQTKCREGSGCLAVDYAMNKGGRSEITVPVNAVVENEPAKIALWIYGDGKEAWVRGELIDAAGTRFLIDFTDGSKGVLWKDEWRRVMVPTEAVSPIKAKAGTRPRFPATIRFLSISQDQEALKTSGRLLLDGLQAVYPPAGAQ